MQLIHCIFSFYINCLNNILHSNVAKPILFNFLHKGIYRHSSVQKLCRKLAVKKFINGLNFIHNRVQCTDFCLGKSLHRNF